MITVIKTDHLSEDGWTKPVAAIAFECSCPIEVGVFLPSLSRKSTSKKISFMINGERGMLELDRGELSFLPPIMPINNIVYLQLACEVEPQVSNDLRERGVMIAGARVDENEYVKLSEMAQHQHLSPQKLEEMFGFDAPLVYASVSPESFSENSGSKSDEQFFETLRSHFDADLYLTGIDDPSGIDDPLKHYLENRHASGTPPNIEFDAEFYLKENPDVREADIDPFVHWVFEGIREGRPGKPPELVLEPQIIEDIRIISDEFDPKYYRAEYRDIDILGVDPIQHFCENGWRERRNPNATFSTQYYLDTYQDISDAGINPFMHFIAAGRAEGRLGRHPAGPAADILQNMRPLEVEARLWRKHSPYIARAQNASIDSNILAKLLRDTTQEGRDVVYLAITHDDYLSTPGGIQLCLHREQLLAQERGANYLVIFPIHPLPRMAYRHIDGGLLSGVVLNGEWLGALHWSEIVKAVKATGRAHRSKKTNVSIRYRPIIHQLLGHSGTAVIDLVRATGEHRCALWLHDYVTVCVGYTLQRNKVAYCGAPNLASNACSVCVYGVERERHVAVIDALFGNLSVHVLSPSQVALDIWRAGTTLDAASARVVPHMRLQEDVRAGGETGDHLADAPATVAFIGTIAPHKGWPIFAGLVARYRRENRFRFVYFGNGQVPVDGVERTPVTVTANDPDAMIRAVREAGVDIVLHWASWPETFSISTFEAMAGGAAVLTNAGSGNVAAAVETHGLGRVLEDEDSLLEFFEGPELSNLVAELRARKAKRTITHSFSALAFEAEDIWSSDRTHTGDL